MGLTQIKRETSKLTPRKLKLFDEWIHGLMRKAEDEAVGAGRKIARGKTIEERAAGDKTYRLQGVRCGKENCRCSRGKPHGPYWYSYARVEGTVKSQYVGKKLTPQGRDEFGEFRQVLNAQGRICLNFLRGRSITFHRKRLI